MITRIIAPSRLHFGLLHVPIEGEIRVEERVFGGVGLMIDNPGVVVTTKPAETWQFEGPLASRAQEFAIRFMQTLPETARKPFQVLIERCPEEHTGLGVGTQLGLSVAKALAIGSRLPDSSSASLAARIRRGERSAVGVHGFEHGGLLIESGKLPGEVLSPMIAHIRLPEDWRVVLFTPPSTKKCYGSSEQLAFSTATGGQREVLHRLVNQAILPAARAGELNTFGDAVFEFNRLAGAPFAKSQFGSYASQSVTELIANLREQGIRGVGQSSWGPTVFAIVGDSDIALSLVLRYRTRLPVRVARVSGGHRVERE
jgi:beta-ribofuranosylaminobenzene 5'-phosphate synthase